MNSFIEAIACQLPNRIVTNQDLQIENPNWNMDAIVEKTGVYQRHIALENETAFDLARIAVDKIFSHSRHQIDMLDGIIFCTQTPDYILPQNSHLLHHHLNLKDSVFAFDLNLACSGYVYALSIADSYIRSGIAKSILIVTADTYSKLIHPKNRSLRTLFGDGASATLISSEKEIKGFNGFELATNGLGGDRFMVPAGGSRTPPNASMSLDYLDTQGNINSPNKIHMDGMAVWSFVNSKIPRQIQNHLEKIKLSINEIDHVFFHQGSKITLDSLVNIMNLNKNIVHSNIKNVGNTVSSSIPICIHDAINNKISSKKIKIGDNMLLSSFGVGLSYGVTSFLYERECHVY